MIFQGSFAFAAKSEAMIADTLAMSVDAFTYLFNLLAERLKHSSLLLGRSVDGISKRELTRRRKELRLYLELLPPLLSVIALIIVSIQTFKDAVITIVQQQHPLMSSSGNDINTEDEPNVGMMLFFSCLNLMLDIMNVTCFSKAKNFSIGGMDGLAIQLQKGTEGQQQEDETENLSSDEEHGNGRRIDVESGTQTMSERSQLLEKETSDTKDYYYGTNSVSDSHQQSICSASASESEDDDLCNDDDHRVVIKNNQYVNRTDRGYKKRKPDVDDDLSEGSDNDYDSDISVALSEESEEGLNLNMCSAYTHVMADTLRSIAVLIAAAIAYSVEGVNPSMADAVASMVVSIIIAISLGPLLVGLFETARELLVIRKERETERKEERTDSEVVFLEKFQNLPQQVQ